MLILELIYFDSQHHMYFNSHFYQKIVCISDNQNITTYFQEYLYSFKRNDNNFLIFNTKEFNL